MAACLFGAILAPIVILPVLLAVFAWPQAFAGALASAALPIAAAGVLAATGSRIWTGLLVLGAATAALGGFAALSGGLASPVLPLLALIPLEAALLSRRGYGLGAGVLAASIAVAANAALGQTVALDAAVHTGGLAAAISLLLYALVRGGAAMLHDADATIAAAEAARIEMAARPRAGAPLTEDTEGPDPADMLDRLPGLVTRHMPAATWSAWRAATRRIASSGSVTLPVVGMSTVSMLRTGSPFSMRSTPSAVANGVATSSFASNGTILPRNSCTPRSLCRQRSTQRASSRAPWRKPRDISDLVAEQVQANAVAEEAETANASKTRFLAAVSHELRTPLNAIIGFSDILAREYFGAFSDERQREYVGLIHQSGEHLLGAGQYHARHVENRIRPL
jgi:cell cycle sensor histidine kinase DivJ